MSLDHLTYAKGAYLFCTFLSAIFCLVLWRLTTLTTKQIVKAQRRADEARAEAATATDCVLALKKLVVEAGEAVAVLQHDIQYQCLALADARLEMSRAVSDLGSPAQAWLPQSILQGLSISVRAPSDGTPELVAVRDELLIVLRASGASIMDEAVTPSDDRKITRFLRLSLALDELQLFDSDDRYQRVHDDADTRIRAAVERTLDHGIIVFTQAVEDILEDCYKPTRGVTTKTMSPPMLGHSGTATNEKPPAHSKAKPRSARTSASATATPKI